MGRELKQRALTTIRMGSVTLLRTNIICHPARGSMQRDYFTTKKRMAPGRAEQSHRPCGCLRPTATCGKLPCLLQKRDDLLRHLIRDLADLLVLQDRWELNDSDLTHAPFSPCARTNLRCASSSAVRRVCCARHFRAVTKNWWRRVAERSTERIHRGKN